MVRSAEDNYNKGFSDSDEIWILSLKDDLPEGMYISPFNVAGYIAYLKSKIN